MKKYIIRYENNFNYSYYTGLLDDYNPSNWTTQFDNSVTVFPDLDSVNKLFSSIHEAVGSEYIRKYCIYEYVPPSVGAKVVSKQQHIDNLQYIAKVFTSCGSTNNKMIQDAINYIKET